MKSEELVGDVFPGCVCVLIVLVEFRGREHRSHLDGGGLGKWCGEVWDRVNANSMQCGGGRELGEISQYAEGDLSEIWLAYRRRHRAERRFHQGEDSQTW